MPRPANTPLSRTINTKDWDTGFGHKPIQPPKKKPTAEQLLSAEAEAARLKQIRLRAEFLRRDQEREAA